MDQDPRTTRVLLLGFDPAAVPGQDPEAIAPAFAHARARAVAEGIDLVECLVGLDGGAATQILGSLRAGSWDCVVIGGGIRKPEPALEFFEYVVNLTRVHAPTAAIAFNASPADTVEAAVRALRLAARSPAANADDPADPADLASPHG